MKIESCRICGSRDLRVVLDLGVQALTGVFPRTVSEKVTQGPLVLVKCMEDDDKKSCGLLQLAHTFNSDEMYGDNYGYRSGINQTMVDHLACKVRDIVALVTLNKGDCVLDIGSNDGTLLSNYSSHVLRVGIDPTGKKFSDLYPQGSTLIPEFFSAQTFLKHFPLKKAKAVTSIAMFYDLECPFAFMKDIYEVLDDEGVWLFEQSYMPTMLDKTSYDTICHEHYEYYGLHQIKWMADRAGFKIVDVTFNDINGGSFAVVVAKQSSSHQENKEKITSILAAESARGLHTLQPFLEFKERVEAHKQELIATVQRLKSEGKKIIGYGASTKGNVILQYCGFDKNDVLCIADRNPYKDGRFTPGSYIPIVSEQEARGMHGDYFLPLPWHFRDEFLQREKEFLSAGGKFLFPLPQIEVVGI